jgi:hypothetical protein
MVQITWSPSALNDIVLPREVRVKGIQFIVDDAGEKKAVLIDLKTHGDVWEDIYDTLLARRRANEPRESIETVRKRLTRRGLLGKDS